MHLVLATTALDSGLEMFQIVHALNLHSIRKNVLLAMLEDDSIIS